MSDKHTPQNISTVTHTPQNYGLPKFFYSKPYPTKLLTAQKVSTVNHTPPNFLQ